MKPTRNHERNWKKSKKKPAWLDQGWLITPLKLISLLNPAAELLFLFLCSLVWYIIDSVLFKILPSVISVIFSMFQEPALISSTISTAHVHTDSLVVSVRLWSTSVEMHRAILEFAALTSQGALRAPRALMGWLVTGGTAKVKKGILRQQQHKKRYFV